MADNKDPRARRAALAAPILAAVFFVVDLLVPLGVAGGIPYIAVVLLTLWLPQERSTWFAAGACSLLVIVGFVGSPPGAQPIAAVSNRVLALFAIWTLAIVLNRRQRAETMLQLAVMGAPQAILVVDERGAITLANPRVRDVFDYEPSELEGRIVDELVPNRLRASHADDRRSFHDAPSARAMGAGRDLYARRKDGSRVAVEIGLTPLETERGRLTICTIIDITERKKTERAVIRHRDDLETLLHVISHDLKEPLRAITSFSRMVQSRAPDSLDAKSRDFLERVVKAAERLRHLLDDVLALARAREVDPTEKQKIDARELVDDALERLAERVEAAGAAIEVVDPLPTLAVDRTWVTEAVYNLLSNALKFYRDGGSPEIEVAAYQPGDDDTGEVGIVVRDRGPGVPAKDRGRIFSLFQRAHGREVEGTGAGLAIVRAVAERHGGRAWVSDRPGGGSEFVITFAITGRDT